MCIFYFCFILTENFHLLHEKTWSWNTLIFHTVPKRLLKSWFDESPISRNFFILFYCKVSHLFNIFREINFFIKNPVYWFHDFFFSSKSLNRFHVIESLLLQFESTYIIIEQCGKVLENAITPRIFREINYFVTSLVKALIWRKKSWSPLFYSIFPHCASATIDFTKKSWIFKRSL